ncbi:hypothetical protein [Xylella fastidiosa]|uniref:hypothetical protein n=2 Tax=Xylella fastidiosa TaxID=2371 RepID=UPI0012683CC6|nr:hypothetical protein [Xylella fastidiosa]MDC6413144.1 hypothetical protein [Xylella fastidiosa subsp. multiplex]MDD0862374.1 hypothetical protein [Xylella fastidiosa subsp. multiplex]MDD0871516.1 hypothetical protein [Xylella fastidiosa subsp. multiplex]MDD0873729.1 hypothetical protein [Xylella fastidiosa subsp. multiplex]MDD0875674.1 hypothetical protein [Xylella fastidiosa subsp. multiplex]
MNHSHHASLMYTMRILSSLGPTKHLIAHSKSVRIAPLRGAIPQAVKTTTLSTTPPGPYPTPHSLRSVVLVHTQQPACRIKR